jgi:hypothetical protein
VVEVNGATTNDEAWVHGNVVQINDACATDGGSASWFYSVTRNPPVVSGLTQPCVPIFLGGSTFVCALGFRLSRFPTCLVQHVACSARVSICTCIDLHVVVSARVSFGTYLGRHVSRSAHVSVGRWSGNRSYSSLGLLLLSVWVRGGWFYRRGWCCCPCGCGRMVLSLGLLFLFVWVRTRREGRP